MPDFSKFDVYTLMGLLFPGLVMVQAYSFGQTSRLRGITSNDLVIYALWSGLYAVALLLLGQKLPNDALIRTMPFRDAASLFLAQPALIGLLFGVASRFELMERLLRRLGLMRPEPPPIRTPWPVVAPKIAVGTYLMVILKDKTIYRALVTEDSLLSSDQDKIDLFLGQTFEGDEWTPSSPQRSVYIRGSEIQSIEIWNFNPAEENGDVG